MRVVFEGTALNGYDEDNNLVMHQPFKPTPTGQQVVWTNEAEAMAWAEQNVLNEPTIPQPTTEPGE